MAFPVTVKFKRTLKASIDADNIGSTLNYIQEELLKKKADKITVDREGVNYKGSTSYSRSSLFGGMNGTFALISEGNKTMLIYEIRMYQLFIFTSVMAVAFGILTQTVWVSLGALAWLCGMNWLVSLIRHGSLATEIASGIDKFHGITAVEEKEEPIRDEKLKSWM